MSSPERKREDRRWGGADDQDSDVSAETPLAPAVSARQRTDPLFPDTHPEALAVLLARYSEMTPAQKLEIVRDLTLTSSRLALAGLRARHPTETLPELLLRLARIRLGSAVVESAYGPLTDADDA